MSWNYAELSKAAKVAGGPEALTELLVQSGRNQMVPWLIGFTVIGTGVGIGITKAVEFFQARRRISNQVVEMARQEIIDGINEYDASHAGEKQGEED